MIKFSVLICCLYLLCYGDAVSQEYVRIAIDPSTQYQTIEGFGASDAWSCQFAGLWPIDKRNKMADLLFSKKNGKNGQPLGIGLNMWRFSIGAGSAMQGASSNISDDWRRQLSFLQLDNNYDWKAMPGQIWFLKAAKNRGVNEFIGFVNSPHVLFTKNGKAYSDDGKCNLDFEKLPAFSADLVSTIRGLKRSAGIFLNYISPANEPQWKWNEHSQEGCPYNNDELALMIKGVNDAFSKNKLSTKIQVGEAGQLDYLYDNGDEKKGNQVFQFFNAKSSNYIGSLSNVDNSISGHSYFTTSPEKKFLEVRRNTSEAVAEIKGLRYWMSEYCVLGDEVLKGEKRDLGMTTALFIAKLIHHDLVISNATSWQWWLAISSGDYKDGLVYIDRSKANGNVYDSKMLWALGNFSRFINKGSRRVKVQVLEGKTDQVFFSSYIYKKKLVTVAVNTSERNISLNMEIVPKTKKTVETYVTSADHNLAPYKQYQDNRRVEIPSKSITTIVNNIL